MSTPTDGQQEEGYSDSERVSFGKERCGADQLPWADTAAPGHRRNV